MTGFPPPRSRAVAALLALVALAVLVAAPRARADEPAFQTIRVVLVRHAEKAQEPQADPPLSEAGRHRAHALADLLGPSGVTALYASDRLRTRQTLEPLAERSGLAIESIDGKDTAATARAVLSQSGGVVVVAGHSNTLGPILEALGGEKIPPIDDADFDNLFVVTVYAPGRATWTRLRWKP